MSNPNATASTLAAGVAVAAQWLVQRYAHVSLDGYWQAVVTAAASTVVLYVGKHGVKTALARVWNGPRKAWTGQQQQLTEPAQ